MNSSATPNLDPSTTEEANRPPAGRANRLFSDWRVSVLALIGLWAVIYLAGISRPPLLTMSTRYTPRRRAKCCSGTTG